MNKQIMRVDRVERGQCPFCNATPKPKDFRDDLSRREFKISGMCQVCQDDLFKEPEHDPLGDTDEMEAPF